MVIRIILLILLSSLFSCSPQKRLSNLIKRHPELISRDTIYKDTTIVKPAVEVKGESEIDKNYSDLLLLIDGYKDRLDSVTSGKLKTEIKNYIINKPILNDTIRIDTAGFHFRLFESGGKLKYVFNKDADSTTIKIPTIVNSVNPVQTEYKIHWYDMAARWLAGITLAFILFILLKKVHLL